MSYPSELLVSLTYFENWTYYQYTPSSSSRLSGIHQRARTSKKNNRVARQIQSTHTFQLLRETQRTAKPCAPPITSLRCQILACSEEQSAQLLHQRVYAPPAPLAGPPTPLQGHKSNQCSKCKRGSQSQTPSHSEVCSKCHSRETTCEWKCNIAVARLFSSDTTTLQSPRVSRLSRPCLIDSPSIPQKKLNTPFWECTSNTTRPTRMTRSTLLRQEGPSCHNRVRSIPTCTTACNSSRSRDPVHSRAGIRRCRDMPNRVKRSSAEFTALVRREQGTVADTRQKNRTYPETNMCSQRMSTTIRKVQQQRQQPFQPTESERTTAVPGPSSARQQRQKPIWSS